MRDYRGDFKNNNILLRSPMRFQSYGGCIVTAPLSELLNSSNKVYVI